MIRDIVVEGEAVLRRVSAPIERFDEELRALVSDMVDTMIAAPGVGLAAPQIGVDAAVFVWRYSGRSRFDERYGAALGLGGARPSSGAVVNPRLSLEWDPERVLPSAPDLECECEGCLSFPGYQYPLRRATRAVLEGFTPDGEPLRVEAAGWLARIFQHEYGHLGGRLYIDHLAEPWAGEAAAVKSAEGWGSPGIFWTPRPS